MDEEDNSEATLIDRWISFDHNSKGLENWLLRFGDSQRDESILYRINAEITNDEVHTQIDELMSRIIEIKQSKEQAIRQRILDKLEQAEFEESERKRKELEEEEERKRKE